MASRLSGSAGLRKSGTGRVILTGANNYTGGTSITAGTLQIGNGGTAGQLGTGNVVNDGTLELNRSNALTVSNVISGTGAVIHSGAGTTTFTGTNTYSGLTTISAGTLQIGSGSTTGTLGTGDVVNSGVLTFNRSDALAVANSISGTGALRKSGNGTTTLTGSNSYTGTTTITAGTLQIGNGGTTGTLGTGAIINSGTLTFNRSNAVTMANVMSGSGRLTQVGTGTTTLTGNNTYTGITTISGGTLQIGDGGTTGTLGTGAVTNNGVLAFNRGNAVAFGGVISGSGSLTQIGAGTTTLTGSNTYTGVTTISDGALQIGNGGTTGQLGTGAVVNNSALIFNRSNAHTVANAISGTGSLTKTGAGTTTLTGTNTYSGTTTILAGTLQIGSGSTAGSLGTGAVVNSGVLTFNRSNALTVANAISGAGALVKSGGGTTTLTGTNSYTGTTTITAGTLQIGNGGSSGTVGTGAIANSAILTVNRSDAFTLGNAMSGTGRLIQLGAGTTTLTANNTYAGTTTISAGALQIGSGGTTGTMGAGAVTNNGVLRFNRSNAFTVANAIGGTGAVMQVGAGITTLTGANSFSGVTTISTGTLQVGNGGTAGQLGSGAVVNNSALIFNRSNSHTVGNAISGSGTLTKAGAGTTTFTGANSYSGSTVITAGTLQIGNGGTTGTLGTGDVLNSGVLRFNRSNALEIASAISGTGSVTKSGTGTTTLTGNNNYTGNTTITTGTLQIGNGGTSGTLGTGAVINGGVLSLNRSDALTVVGAISGAGAITQLGTGTTILTGSNSYTGGTTISGGTLQIGDGGTAGSITGNVTNDGVFSLNRSDAVSFDGVISGAGQLRQLGSGTTTLTADNTYSGGTVISAGTLQVGNGGATGQLGAGTITNNGSLIFNRSDAITIANAIAGAGSMTKMGTGSLTLTGANAFTGTIFNSAGLLQVGDGGTTGTLGTAAVVNGGVLTFNRSDALSVSGDISGSGAVTQVGTGTTTLTGTNTYSGGTTISAGRLVLGDGGTTGSITGNVTNNGALAFNRSDAVAFTGIITGSGAVEHIGRGTTTLTKANAYTGGTAIKSGTLQIGDGGISGSIIGNVTNNGTLAFNRSDAITFGGTISGTGRLRQVGRGTTVLTASNTYTGGTFIASGTLQVGAGGASGSITGDVINNGVLAFNRADRITFRGNIGGDGAVKHIGRGTIVLTGANTYTGGTTIKSGTLQLGAGGVSGSINGNVRDNGVLAFNRADAVRFDGDISGSGSVAQLGTGAITLTGTNSYTGGTTIKSGALHIGDGGTKGSIVGNVVDDGALVFNRSDVVTFDGGISGTGSVVQAGSGTTILTGPNTYTGSTIVRAGTLQIGADGVEESSRADGRFVGMAALKTTSADSGGMSQLSSGPVFNDGAIVFKRGSSVTLTGEMSGTGTLTQAGTGTLTLLGDKTYTGVTLAKSGTVVLNGSLSSPVAVAAGATFAGSGTIFGSATIDGTIAPGLAEAPFNSLHVAGNLELSPGARSVMTIDSAGNHSQLLVGGAATIGGATIAVNTEEGPYGRVTFYPVLYADGGVAGTATAVTTNSTLESWVSSTPNAVALTLVNTTVALESVATTASGASAGAALDRVRHVASGDLATVTRELLTLEDAGLDRALGAIAGQIHASTGQLAALDGEAMMDLVREQTDGRVDSTKRRGTWARLQTLSSGFNSDSVRRGDAQLSQLALATEWSATSGWLAGVGGGYTTGSLSLENVTESSHYAAPRGFAYFGYAGPRSTAHVGASIARGAYQVRRRFHFTALLPEAFGGRPVFGGVNREATSTPTELATDVWGEWSLSNRLGAWSISPSVGARYARYSRQAWTESGAGSLSLSAPAFVGASLHADLGVRVGRTIGRFRPNVSMAHRRQVTEEPVAMIQLSDRAEGLYSVDGAHLTADHLTTRAGVTYAAGDVGLSLAYELRSARVPARQTLRFGVEF